MWFGKRWIQDEVEIELVSGRRSGHLYLLALKWELEMRLVSGLDTTW